MFTHLPHILTASLASAHREGGASTFVQMIAAMGVLLLSFTMLTLLRRRLRRQASLQGMTAQDRIRAVREKAQRRPGKSAPTSLASTAARTSVEAVMADAEELTRRLAAVLDNKAAALEILLDRANEASTRLEQAAGTSTNQPAPGVTPAGDPIAAEVYALADQGRTALEIASALDEPTGKVELILALRQPAPRSPTGTG